ncbi:hypothetical protein DPMN_006577 [Dreissena polymorpha]|uniref:Uncharacterized protein n=1 Tax=Dreissena polymorpha TaxID=45954 RepID=A0A9D4MS61_DREPO|nr:hypothetical protein DPMN_072024 [Dreissena polymorpha]KAH3882633.1 hypothetical protein DPMN_006577 [Dreissena polymorpha]
MAETQTNIVKNPCLLCSKTQHFNLYSGIHSSSLISKISCLVQVDVQRCIDKRSGVCKSCHLKINSSFEFVQLIKEKLSINEGVQNAEKRGASSPITPQLQKTVKAPKTNLGPESESESETVLDDEEKSNDDHHYSRPLNVRLNTPSKRFQYCHPVEDETVVADIQSNSTVPENIANKQSSRPFFTIHL